VRLAGAIFAKYALQLSMHGVTGTDGGKKKYPLNTSQKKNFTL
jgi:hypothetical protein